MLFENSEFIFYLKKSLDIDINKILDKTVDKYKLKILKIERKNIINYFDCKKSIIEKNLTLNIKK